MRLTTVNTFQEGGSNDKGILAEYRGLNIKRRRIRCDSCKEIFYTVELVEQEFQHLRRKTGRLEVVQAQVRPGVIKS